MLTHCGVPQQNDLARVEAELCEALEASRRSRASGDFDPARPLPPPWERGVSLALLDKFASECCHPDASTEAVVAALRSRLVDAGRRCALVGLLRDAGVRVAITRPVRLVSEDGVEFDDPEGSVETIQVTSPRGIPLQYVFFNFEQSLCRKKRHC